MPRADTARQRAPRWRRAVAAPGPRPAWRSSRARGGHLTIGEIAAATDVPLPTVHRLLRTLVDRGYMRQMPNRRYALGFRLVPLGATASSMVGADTGVRSWAGSSTRSARPPTWRSCPAPHAEYVAQVPSRHTMRMFTEVGRQVDLHCTGVGKALLAQLDDARVRDIVRRVGLPRQTEHTLVTEADLLADLAVVREPAATPSTSRSRRPASAASPCRSARSRCPGWRCPSPARSPG